MRLLIVSNRLPVTVTEKNGQLTFQSSSGGLVSGLSAYLDSLGGSRPASYDSIWIGWPGSNISEALQETLRAKLMKEKQSYPVFLPEKIMDNFYHGFCNKTIWPLFHYFPTYASFDEQHWKDYRSVNEQFCETILKAVQPDDIVWIHDYHLMLLPQLLRKKNPNLRIGFFLHIPFPSFEIFRLLPSTWRSEILEGLLGADLVGFHTHDYTQYFLHCCLRLLGYEHSMGQILIHDRLITADTFPMGIDYQKYHEAAASPVVEKECQGLRKTLKNLKVILSLDRLDYSKGILNRLKGFEKFLEFHDEWRKKVVLILVLVPSRINVDQYQKLKHQIDEYVGLINGRFGGLDWVPIIYQYKSLPFSELMTLYRVSDVALVTPLRDGMNLIAKEYIASRTDCSGVLILSEMVGASRELGEVVTINPTTPEEIAKALKTALEMPLEEQVKRNEAVQKRLETYNVTRWAEDFIQKLTDTREEQEKFHAKILKQDAKNEMLKKYRASRRRLLFLDYDGTLVPFANRPEMAQPNDDLLALLQRLCKNPKTELVIISGRSKEFLGQWFGKLPLHLVAEHGVWIRKKNEDWQLSKPIRNDWKPQLLPLLKIAADRLPGAFVEEKEFSLVWHYRQADQELASVREKELLDDLVRLTASTDLQVFQGHKVVEIKNAGISKGNAAMLFLSEELDFILAIGDDTTDEELFKSLPDATYSLRVGLANSYARFNLPRHEWVIPLLQELVEEKSISSNNNFS